MENRTIIKPLYALSSLELWTQCYFRWIPTLEIHNGGQRHIELYIRLLQNDVNQLGINENRVSPIDKVGIYSLHTNIDSFYPFSNNRSGNTVSAPIMNSSILLSESLLDAQSLITATDWQDAIFTAFKTRTWFHSLFLLPWNNVSKDLILKEVVGTFVKEILSRNIIGH